MPFTENHHQELKLEITTSNKNQLKQSSLYRWYLDSPKQGATHSDANSCVHIRGWVLCDQVNSIQVVARTPNKTYYFNLSEARPDVVRRVLQQNPKNHPKLICGFNFEVNDWSDSLDIGFQTENKPTWAYNIKPSKAAKVKEGKKNWLYLSNDSNSSIQQYTGSLLMSTQKIEQWRDYFQRAETDSIKFGFRWAFLLAPAKEFITPEHYPFEKGKITPVDQLISNHCSFDKIVWPYDALYSEQELTYWKGDTHWTDYGGAVAAQETLKKLGFKHYKPTNSIPYFIKHLTGDLGGKLTPPRAFPVLIADFSSISESLIFDNGIHNTGRIRIYENSKLEHTKTCCILFGGSSSTNVAPWLVNHFHRLIYIHTAAAIDQSIIEAERPSHVILQTNSRFIINPPKINFSVRSVIKQKLKQLNERKINELQAYLTHHPPSNNEFYKKIMLEAISEI